MAAAHRHEPIEVDTRPGQYCGLTRIHDLLLYEQVAVVAVLEENAVQFTKGEAVLSRWRCG